jgi:stage II sporulation protein D
MKKQPVLNVGIMSEPVIEFMLDTGYHYGETLLNPGHYNVRIMDSKLILEGKDVFIIKEDDIVLLPVFRTNSFMLKEVTIGLQFHWEQKEDQRFTGGIRFIPEKGKVRVINTIYLEDYLKSVISSEMSATCSINLLKAHAVISRSWILAQIEKNRQLVSSSERYETNYISPDRIIRWYDREDHTDFDVCADDHCQRYQGITKIISAKATEAVETTWGEILMQGEEICDARFSKCCGGISESFENVWEPKIKTYLTSVVDAEPLGNHPSKDLKKDSEAEKWILSSPPAFCNTSDPKILSQVLPGFDQKTRDFFRWKVEYSREELSGLIKKRSGIDFGDIIALEPLERGFSGRIVQLRVVGTRQTVIVGKELEIRKWLSPAHLYSSGFTVHYEDLQDKIPGKIILRGAGWGHGVGLCQIGAAVMGEQGYDYREILGHYFKNTEIKSYYQ